MEKKKVARAIRRGLEGRRDRWGYGLAALVSFTVFVVFWWTNVFRDAILSNLELRNGTSTFLLWQRPPVGLTIRVYVFNYTNLQEFESGNASKLRVEEVGPFVYRETLTRVNVERHENGTLTYQEKRTYQWISGMSESEKVIVPNVLLLSAVAYSRDVQFFFQLGVTIMLSSLSMKPFLELPVGEYLWGYEDRLFEMMKPFASLKHPMPYENFGLLALKQGVSPDRITMHTGEGDLGRLGLIQRVNGMEYTKVWDDERCDKVYGTDGSMFPPDWIEDSNSTLYVYVGDACRQLPLRYAGRSFSSGIPTLRYKVPDNVFTVTPTKDSCFCSKRVVDKSIAPKCPPAGTFNISACKFGAPLLVSFPHFYAGDETLFEHIDGLTPEQRSHDCYVDLHPRLGVTVDTRMRLQLNLEVRKAIAVPFSGRLKDGLILPLIWVDSAIDEMPESVQDIFYQSHYLVNGVEAALQWCSLICAILSISAVIVTCAKNEKEKGDAGFDAMSDRRSSDYTAPVGQDQQ